MDKKTKELQENFENLKNVTTELNVLSEDNASLKINLKEQENKITSLEEQKRIIEKEMTIFKKLNMKEDKNCQTNINAYMVIPSTNILKPKKDKIKRDSSVKCSFKKCNGQGNTRKNYKSHTSIKYCPMAKNALKIRNNDSNSSYTDIDSENESNNESLTDEEIFSKKLVNGKKEQVCFQVKIKKLL